MRCSGVQGPGISCFLTQGQQHPPPMLLHRSAVLFCLFSQFSFIDSHPAGPGIPRGLWLSTLADEPGRSQGLKSFHSVRAVRQGGNVKTPAGLFPASVPPVFPSVGYRMGCVKSRFLRDGSKASKTEPSANQKGPVYVPDPTSSSKLVSAASQGAATGTLNPFFPK